MDNMEDIVDFLNSSPRSTTTTPVPKLKLKLDRECELPSPNNVALLTPRYCAPIANTTPRNEFSSVSLGALLDGDFLYEDNIACTLSSSSTLLFDDFGEISANELLGDSNLNLEGDTGNATRKKTRKKQPSTTATTTTTATATSTTSKLFDAPVPRPISPPAENRQASEVVTAPNSTTSTTSAATTTTRGTIFSCAIRRPQSATKKEKDQIPETFSSDDENSPPAPAPEPAPTPAATATAIATEKPIAKSRKKKAKNNQASILNMKPHTFAQLPRALNGFNNSPEISPPSPSPYSSQTNRKGKLFSSTGSLRKPTKCDPVALAQRYATQEKKQKTRLLLRRSTSLSSAIKFSSL